MSNLFVVRDKTDRIIYLSNERWKHIQKHPGVNNVEILIETLQFPNFIKNNKYEDNISYYYKYYKEINKFLFISVKYLNGKGFIITAYFVLKVK